MIESLTVQKRCCYHGSTIVETLHEWMGSVRNNVDIMRVEKNNKIEQRGLHPHNLSKHFVSDMLSGFMSLNAVSSQAVLLFLVHYDNWINVTTCE